MLRSPILLLADQIAGAPFNVAPEKANRCANHRDDHRIECVNVDEAGFGIRVRRSTDGKGHEIVLPIAALEYLWSFAHYSWVLTQEYASAQRTAATEFDCVGSKRLGDSFAILNWAKQNLSGSGTEEWPATGPRPKQDVHSVDDVRVANELFLGALGWIIHHEFGHVVLKHPLGIETFSIQQEQEADRYATDWLLDELNRADPRVKKRALCLSIAVLCLQSLEVKSACLSNTHPGAHERIYANTARFQFGEDEIVFATCAVVLQYLFNDTGIKAKVDGATFSDILSDLLFDVARSKDATGHRA
jgi:hypothetical protein